MFGKWVSVILTVLVILGAVVIAFFFWGRDIRNYLPIEGEPSAEDSTISQNILLSTVLSATTDLTQQTTKLKAEGYKDNYIVADITSVDKARSKLGLSINLPGEGVFETQDVTAESECTAQNTATVSRDDFSVLKESAKLFEEAKVGDVLWAYCLDDSCETIGRECVLIKVAGEE